MPEAAEKKIKAQGGAVRWRTIKKDGQTMRVAVTKNKGPRGGRTVAYPIDTDEPAGGRGKKW